MNHENRESGTLFHSHSRSASVIRHLGRQMDLPLFDPSMRALLWSVPFLGTVAYSTRGSTFTAIRSTTTRAQAIVVGPANAVDEQRHGTHPMDIASRPSSRDGPSIHVVLNVRCVREPDDALSRRRSCLAQLVLLRSAGMLIPMPLFQARADACCLSESHFLTSPDLFTLDWNDPL